MYLVEPHKMDFLIQVFTTCISIIAEKAIPPIPKNSLIINHHQQKQQ